MAFDEEREGQHDQVAAGDERQPAAEFRKVSRWKKRSGDRPREKQREAEKRQDQRDAEGLQRDVGTQLKSQEIGAFQRGAVWVRPDRRRSE